MYILKIIKNTLLSVCIITIFSLSGCLDGRWLNPMFASGEEPLESEVKLQSVKLWTAKELKSFKKWIELFKKRALASGLKQKFLDDVFEDIDTPNPRIYKLLKTQPENSFTFLGYINRLDLTRRYKDILDHKVKKDKILQKAGILSSSDSLYSVILAIWSLESNLGQYTGNHNVIESLSTLSWFSRRRRFFSAELLQALHIVNNNLWDKSDYSGSWAGAAGSLQLMPSNIVAYGTDGDGNGIIDPIHSAIDAFSSGVNLLKSLRWVSSKRWGWQVSIPKKNDSMVYGIKTMPWRWWKNKGVKIAYKDKQQPGLDEQLTLHAPLGVKGPAWLTGYNFKRILIWNNSIKYALSVGILSDLISGHKVPEFWQTSSLPKVISVKTIKKIQTVLKEKGIYHGSIDGVFGVESQAAFNLWEKKNKSLSVNGVLDFDDIQNLLAEYD